MSLRAQTKDSQKKHGLLKSRIAQHNTILRLLAKSPTVRTRADTGSLTDRLLIFWQQFSNSRK